MYRYIPFISGCKVFKRTPNLLIANTVIFIRRMDINNVFELIAHLLYQDPGLNPSNLLFVPSILNKR